MLSYALRKACDAISFESAQLLINAGASKFRDCIDLILDKDGGDDTNTNESNQDDEDDEDLVRLFRLLVSNFNEEINIGDEYGYTILHRVCFSDRGRLSFARVLIFEFHADVNVVADDGATPLTEACRYGTEAMVRS